MNTNFDKIEATYGIRYWRGMYVWVNGKYGRITSSDGARINVLFGTTKKPVPCHPTWRVSRDCRYKKGERPDDICPECGERMVVWFTSYADKTARCEWCAVNKFKAEHPCAHIPAFKKPLLNISES